MLQVQQHSESHFFGTPYILNTLYTHICLPSLNCKMSKKGFFQGFLSKELTFMNFIQCNCKWTKVNLLGKNNVPPSVSKRVRLYVDFPPTLWITHQLVGVGSSTEQSSRHLMTTTQVEIGGIAMIECLTAAHPKSLNFWHDTNNQFIRADQK